MTEKQRNTAHNSRVAAMGADVVNSSEVLLSKFVLS